MTQARVELLADSRQVRRATDDLQALENRGKSTTTAVQLLGRAFVALGSAAVIGKAINTTRNFSQAIADLSAITGATGRDLQFYREQAAEIGRTTSLSASQAAEAFKLIGSSQPELLKNAEALAAVTKEAVTLAEATGQDLPSAASALSSAINQFGLDAGSARDVINQLAAASKQGTVEVPLLTESLRNVGSAANALGLDLTQTVAGIQALAKANIQGSEAGTALRQVLLGLENTADGQLQPSIVGLNQALATLAERNLSNNELLKIFGREGFTAATALLAQRDTAEQLNQTLRGTNTAVEQASVRMDTLTGDMKQFGSAVEGLTIAVLGDEFDGLARSATQLGTEAINGLTENLDVLGDVAKVVAGIFAARMAGSLAASTAAFIAGQREAVRYQAALASMAGVSGRAAASQIALGTAVRGASAALALVGGPVGAAVLASYALYEFVTSGDSTEDKIDELVPKLQQLTEGFDGLTAAQARNREQELTTQLGDLIEESNRYREELADLKADLQDPFVQASATQYKAVQDQVARVTEELKLNQVEQKGLETAISEVVQRMLELDQRANESAESLNANGQAAKNVSSNYESLAQSLRAQIIEYELGEEAGENYRLMSQLNAGASREEAEALLQLQERLKQIRQEREQQAGMVDPSREIELPSNVFDQLEQEREAYDNSKALAKEAADYVIEQETRKANEVTALANSRLRAEQQVQSQALGLAQSTFGAIADTVKRAKGEESAAYKVAFAAQKAAAIAQAIINTESAAVAALAPPPIGLGPVAGAGYAGVIRGLGYASIGVMAGQAIGELAGGRAAGGQVLAGNEYLVGERGPEIVRMNTNGSVVPNSQLRNEMNNSGGGVSVNVQNYGSNQVQVKDRGRDPMTGKQVVDILVSELGTHGSRSLNALNKTTNVSTRTA